MYYICIFTCIGTIHKNVIRNRCYITTTSLGLVITYKCLWDNKYLAYSLLLEFGRTELGIEVIKKQYIYPNWYFLLHMVFILKTLKLKNCKWKSEKYRHNDITGTKTIIHHRRGKIRKQMHQFWTNFLEDESNTESLIKKIPQ